MLKTQFLLADIYKIYYLVVNGSHLVTDFIDSLPEKDQKKINSLLWFTAKQGPPNNTETFMSLNQSPIEFYVLLTKKKK